MRVHIITNDTTSDQILARLARKLLELPDWSASETPDPSADLNYYFPYLWYDGFHGTPVAAWFTHLEETGRRKISLWQNVSRVADLRMTSAKIYETHLAEIGPTRFVTTPLDRDKFKPGPAHPARERKVVGTSGFVYASGRKGEGLIRQLMASPLGKTIDLVASGEGWPCHTRLYDWTRVQEFYQALDVYICTSTVEGIGYGPLEALACGVPVVIPRGVGVFDELPGAQNLFRYKAGDFGDLCRMIERALAEPVNRDSLRAITARFSDEAWQQGHMRAFQELLGGAPPLDVPSPWQGRAGIYYVAYGAPARECAVRAITAAHKAMTGIPCALASDAPGCGEDVFIQNPDEDIGGRSVKTKIYDLAPKEWEYILYCDADTEIVGDARFLFDLLADGWEMACCVNPAQYVMAANMIRRDNDGECKETFDAIGTDQFLQLNGARSSDGVRSRRPPDARRDSA